MCGGGAETDLMGARVGGSSRHDGPSRVPGASRTAIWLETRPHGLPQKPLWSTPVLEVHRRRGIQQALIAHRLAIGHRHGCEVALTESKPGIPTERNAGRRGLTLACTRLAFRAPRALPGR